MSIISSDIAKAVALLRNEDLVVIPTETVYGLAGNIYSEVAIRKIFETKQRPLFNPLIVHISSADKLNDIVSVVPEKAKQLAEAFWPGSLTMVLPKKDVIPDLVTAGKDTVAVRVPNHPVTLELLKQLPFPLAAPSANPFGCISPTTANHVENYFKDLLPMVLEGGACTNGIESTIVGFEDGAPIVYRLGAIAIEEIESVIGPVQLKNKKESAPDAPGMLSRHYAPETTTVLVDDAQAYIHALAEMRIGVITFNHSIVHPRVVAQQILSDTNDLKSATAKLYAALHHLDTLDLEIIVAQRFPEEGLGRSINDRLSRATKKK